MLFFWTWAPYQVYASTSRVVPLHVANHPSAMSAITHTLGLVEIKLGSPFRSQHATERAPLPCPVANALDGICE